MTCYLHGDDKLHVNVFVPSGSDESDCTPGILFVCQRVCVCVYVCMYVCVSVYVGYVRPCVAVLTLKRIS